MRCSTRTLVTVVAAALAAVASAVPQPELRDENHCATRCYTTMSGKYPAPYHTTWKTSKYPCTTTTTRTSTYTKTASARSETATSTITSTVTASTSTGTETSTVTETDTTTTTSVTTTTTTTSTTTTSTSTVPAPAGFVPIQTSLPGSSYAGSAGPVPMVKRKVDVRAKSPTKVPALGMSKKTYCKGVTCVKRCRGVCKTVTKTRTTTTVITPSATTVTSTTTVSSSIFPSATTTVTTTSTTLTTDTSTSTQTDTSTSTIVVPAAETRYAACAANNVADTYNGEIIGNTSGDSNGEYIISNAASAYDCCVSAALNSRSELYGYFPGFQPNYCLIVAAASTCSAQSKQFDAYTGDQGFGQVTIGNGLCGIINSTT